MISQHWSKMILTIEKKIEFRIDTGAERERINFVFKDHKDPEVLKRLNLLLDFVEKGEWKQAWEEITSPWWQEDDKEDEYSRLEYIGFLKHDSPYINHCMDYIELIRSFVEFPGVYKVIETKK